MTKVEQHPILFVEVFSAIAAIRFIKYLYAKLLYLFGLATSNPALAESAWRWVGVGEAASSLECNLFLVCKFPPGQQTLAEAWPA